MVTNNAINQPTGASGTIVQGQGIGTATAFSTATYPSTATGTGTILRADGTNWSATSATYPNSTTINQLLYSSSANTIAGLATANGGVVDTTSSGVPQVDTTNFSVLSTGLQLKGNNTNTAPPAGFIGEQITANATSVALSNGTAKTVTSISLTAGIWDVTGMAFFSAGGPISEGDLGISTTNNALPSGNAGVNYATYTPSPASSTGNTMTIPPTRALLSGTNTYYLVAKAAFASGSVSMNGIIIGTRVG